jgi:hypothetical protein
MAIYRAVEEDPREAHRLGCAKQLGTLAFLESFVLITPSKLLGPLSRETVRSSEFTSARKGFSPVEYSFIPL